MVNKGPIKKPAGKKSPSRKVDLVPVFARNLRRLRTGAAVTQQQLAQMMDVSISYVSMLERGTRNPPLTTIGDVAHALKVPAHALIEV